MVEVVAIIQKNHFNTNKLLDNRPKVSTEHFPDRAKRFDFTGTEWLEQEAFLDPPAGEKRILDVVAKVPTRVPVPDPGGRAADHSLVVIDVEIESPERATDVRPRMLWYYEYLRRQHSLPVVPICLFLRVGRDGIGWDAYEERLAQQHNRPCHFASERV